MFSLRFQQCFRWSLPALIILGSGLMLFGQGPGKTVRRAEPPKFDANSTKAIFFNNAIDEGLVGDRPNLGVAAAVASGGPSTGAAPAGDGGGVGSGTGWSSIISGQTIEDQIKAIKLQVDGSVTTPSDFAGKGYKVVRRDLSVLAMLFGIIGDYDSDVRFKKEAPAARDVFARTAANSKVGTVQVFNEAKLRKQELADLVGGQNPFSGKEGERKPTWNTVCDRSPLMQHLEAIYEPRLKQNLSSEALFKGNQDVIVQDAEIIAAIGQVMMADGMEDADGDDYKAFCQRLVKAGKDIVDGVKLKNYDAASAASTEIGKACTECHENYRS